MSIRINNKIIAGNSSETKSTSYRYVGEIFQSAIPIDDIKVACLDGHKIYSDEGYGSFIQHLISQSVLYPQLVCTEEVWQEKVTQYGSWGQFVINTQENSVRLPKIAGFVQGLNTLEDLAGLLEAGLPNIEGELVNNSSSSASTGGEWYSSSFTQKGALKTTSFVSNEAITGSSYSGGEYLKTISFDASLSNPIYGNSDTVQPQAIQYPYYIVLATGVVQEINIKDEVHLNNPFFFGMYQYFETNPNNVSWLKSEGQWNNGSIYESFYEWLVNSYNDTESGVSIKSYSDTYTNFDYVLNKDDKTFRLPIEVKQKFYNDISGNIPVAGNGMTLGLTNGSVDGGLAIATDASFSVYENALGTPTGYDYTGGAPTSTISYGVTTDPTKSGIEAQITQTEVEGLGLYFYVGEVVQNANIINGKKVLDVLPKKIEKEDIYKGITNCLLEIPQNIKLELNDGVLTLKAGSKVVVPYGTEDLTAQYLKGSTFIHDNFKVYDTQFADGKFFVWAELVNDLPSTTGRQDKQTVTFMLKVSENLGHNATVGSGATYPLTANVTFYNTTNNEIRMTTDTTGSINGIVYSLPLAIVTVENKSFTSIDQVFNGIGYIGSTIWVDKGVKGLIPNGRNEDGTLKNIEVSTQKISVITQSGTSNRRIYLNPDGSIQITGNSYNYNFDENLVYVNSVSRKSACIGEANMTNNVITSFQPKQVFRAVDQNDISSLIANLGGNDSEGEWEYGSSGQSWYMKNKTTGFMIQNIHWASSVTLVKTSGTDILGGATTYYTKELAVSYLQPFQKYVITRDLYDVKKYKYTYSSYTYSDAPSIIVDYDSISNFKISFFRYDKVVTQNYEAYILAMGY